MMRCQTCDVEMAVLGHPKHSTLGVLRCPRCGGARCKADPPHTLIDDGAGAPADFDRITVDPARVQADLQRRIDAAAAAPGVDEQLRAAVGGGRKDDADKAPWDLFPWDAANEVVSVLRFGRDKYAARNWEKGMLWSRPFAAAIRHLWKWFLGETTDPESGLSHLAHAGCCVLFLLAYSVRQTGTDDRPVGRGHAA